MSGLPDSFKVPYDPGLRAGALVVRKTLQYSSVLVATELQCF